ncbi:AAA family ATPase [Devosia sp. PTR5]|uniref:AAA family ATPase n=2 Tax=Devosia TaxID=46913 RepID=A0A927FPX5_9HYPH|nr:AAA family ATPase [Devosia rhizoryzae]MBD8064075.1 AAA family ATPase [Devosia oryzisoli]QQR40105.1 AAA family ATPase [Devosia rhizoryzae]
MLLVGAHVTNFRSVDDSEEFDLAPVTCLVGKNEAGKSAVLLALAALNPHASTPARLDKERDYPRRLLTQYAERHTDEDAVAISTTWQLSAGELARVAAQVGKGVVTDEKVRIFRRYGSKQPEVEADIDYSTAIKWLYGSFQLDEAEVSVIGPVGTTSQLIEKLNALTSLSERQQLLKAHLAKHGSVKTQVDNLIRSMLPKFMYFSSYDRMDGAIQLEQTRKLIANETIDQEQHKGKKLFAEFLSYAGVSIEDITNETTYETFNARLQAASNNITDQILEYWTQNPDLSVNVRVEQARSGDPEPLNAGTIAWARINNALHRVDTPFSERSAGFVWFFSFLVKFAQVKDEDTPVVLLLDEPGLTLHGKAQADLLRFFDEKLAPHHQIVFSTHSPFMVPADDLASVRIVEDQIEMKGPRRLPLGTKVRSDVLSRDPDTIFPLQGALGYEISQSLFVGKHTLLVEGPGDILYIQALSDALKRRGRVGLDQKWTMCPAGGIDKIRPFISLFSGNELQVAVLSDEANGDKRKIDDMKRSAVLRAGHLYTMADFLERPEADIEDMFEPEVFASILNGAYGLEDANKITKDRLASTTPPTARLVKQADALFALMPATVAEFDHYTPASWLIRNPKLLDGKGQPVTATLDRAQKVFDVYNNLLT